VKHLSLVEKEELQELLRKYLIKERRREIRENSEASLEEYRQGKLRSFSNIDEMVNSVAND
jgi:hypothetical protein